LEAFSVIEENARQDMAKKKSSGPPEQNGGGKNTLSHTESLGSKKSGDNKYIKKGTLEIKKFSLGLSRQH
jgi:hypothetical protein